MGTGAVLQTFANFPYSASALTTVAYAFWVLNMLLFTLFTILFTTQSITSPHLMMDIFRDFTQTSYLGAIPVTLSTILEGLVIIYPDHPGAIWAAYIIWWASLALSTTVPLLNILLASLGHQSHHSTHPSSTTGSWLLTSIPCIVVSAVGGTLIPHLQPLSPANATICLVISYLSLCLGVSLSAIIIALLLHRLLRFRLPPPSATISCFIPVGPAAMGSYAVQRLATALSLHIRATDPPFTLTLRIPAEHDPAEPAHPLLPPPSVHAISQSVRWFGVLAALLGVALATFLLVFAVAVLLARPPRVFNAGAWSVVFPVGVYALATGNLAGDLRSEGLKGWAAVWTAGCAVAWVGCCVGCVWRAWGLFGTRVGTGGAEGWVGRGGE